MAATNQNVSIWAGDTVDIVFPISNPDGTPMVLAGATVRWWTALSAFSPDAEVLLKKQSGGQGISITGSTCTVRIDPADLGGASPGPKYHEAEVAFDDGRSFTVLSGKLTLNATLIRPA